MSKTITRLFDSYPDATRAMHALEQIGVPHDDLSIMTHDNARAGHDGAKADGGVDDHGDVGRGVSTGAMLGGVGGLLAGLGLLAIPGLGPIVAAGWLASTAAGAGLGALGGGATGTIVGALKEAGHSEDEANVYSEGVRRGGTLVSAKVPDALIPQAEATLAEHRSVDAAARGTDYRAGGWTRFDDTAPAYTDAEMAAERQRYGASTVTY
jgi:hypothetical protein